MFDHFFLQVQQVEIVLSSQVAKLIANIFYFILFHGCGIAIVKIFNSL